TLLDARGLIEKRQSLFGLVLGPAVIALGAGRARLGRRVIAARLRGAGRRAGSVRAPAAKRRAQLAAAPAGITVFRGFAGGGGLSPVRPCVGNGRRRRSSLRSHAGNRKVI